MKSFVLEKRFLEKYLKTVNRLCDSCVLKIEEDNISSISSSPDNVVILYIKGKLSDNTNICDKINIIDIKRLISGLDCLDSDLIEIQINENYIKCIDKNSGDNAYFKYHLVDDSVMSKSTYSVKKISQLTFNTEFSIPTQCQRKIMSAYSFSSDCSKLYLKEDSGSIYAEINDLTQHNRDSVEIKITNEYIGEPIQAPIPINIEVFKMLSYTKDSNLSVKINKDYNVLIFNIKEDQFLDVKYITSALVK